MVVKDKFFDVNADVRKGGGRSRPENAPEEVQRTGTGRGESKAENRKPRSGENKGRRPKDL